MMRWIFLVLGIASAALGVVGYLMHPPIDVIAQELSVSSAVNVLQDRDLVAVKITAGADTTTRVYAALSETPRFTRKPTTTTYNLADAGVTKEMNAYLGNSVQIETALAPFEIAIQVIREDADSEDHVSGERLLVPIAGYDVRLWVLSPYYGLTNHDRDAWRSTGRSEGVLTRISDIEDNVTSFVLDFDYEQIKAAAADIGLTIDDESLLIIPNNDSFVSGLYRLPIKGADGVLWVSPFYEGQEVPAWVESGPIEGLLRVWKADPELGAISSLKIPQRYGVVYHDETAEVHNVKTTFGLKLFTGLGTALIFLSGIGFFRRRRR